MKRTDYCLIQLKIKIANFFYSNIIMQHNHNNLIMIIASLLAGIFASINLMVYRKSDIRFSLNEIYMVLFMTTLMFFFYDLLVNLKLTLTSIILGITAIVLFLLIRNQILINDCQYLSGMIPHHSMAIQMSDYIINKTTDRNIKKFAENIKRTQLQEIKWIKSYYDHNHN